MAVYRRNGARDFECDQLNALPTGGKVAGIGTTDAALGRAVFGFQMRRSVKLCHPDHVIGRKRLGYAKLIIGQRARGNTEQFSRPFSAS